MEEVFALLSLHQRRTVLGILEGAAENLHNEACEDAWGDDSPIDNENPHTDGYNKIVSLIQTLEKTHRKQNFKETYGERIQNP